MSVMLYVYNPESAAITQFEQAIRDAIVEAVKGGVSIYVLDGFMDRIWYDASIDEHGVPCWDRINPETKQAECIVRDEGEK